MAEITQIRKLEVNNSKIEIEFMFLAHYNHNKTYFSNLDFVTTEGETDDAIDYLKEHIKDYLMENYLDFTRTAELFFDKAPQLESVNFKDNQGYFKVYRKEFEKQT